MKSIQIGNFYRLRGNAYAWAKVLRIIPSCTGINQHNYPIAECEWKINKEDVFGMIKYFKVSELEEGIKEV